LIFLINYTYHKYDGYLLVML